MCRDMPTRARRDNDTSSPRARRFRRGNALAFKDIVPARPLAGGLQSHGAGRTGHGGNGPRREHVMSRINPIDLKTTHEGTRRNFTAIEKQLGVVPNMMRTMAQSPSVLDGYLALRAALGRGLLPGIQAQLALAVAEANACDYCLSAHTVLGHGAGLSEEEVAASREGRAADGRSTAALHFARAVLEQRGGVSDQDLAPGSCGRLRAMDNRRDRRARRAQRVHELFNRAAQTESTFRW